MNCASCGAVMRIAERATRWECDYCGRVEVPKADEDGVAVLGGSTGVGCPICRTELVHATVEGAPVLTCPACHGMLVELGTFLGLVAELRAGLPEKAQAPARAIHPRDLERRVVCPLCHEEMDTHPYAGGGFVVIDNCPRCERNWLDAGDLRRIVLGGSGTSMEDWDAVSY